MCDTKIEELVRMERLEYFRKWRAANKDKIRESNRRYWQKKAERRLQEKTKECEANG